MTALEKDVDARLKREKADLEREAKTADKAKGTAAKDYTAAAAELAAVSDEAIALDDRGEVVPEELAQKIDAAHRRTMAAQAASIGAGNRAARLRQKAEVLDHPSERQRRVDQAKRFAALREAKPPAKKEKVGLTTQEAAALVLRDADGPLHYREITKRILDSGLLRPKGKTPDATVSAALSRSGAFRKVGPGEFDLRDRESVEA